MTNKDLKQLRRLTAGKDAKTACAIADRFYAMLADRKEIQNAMFMSEIHKSDGAMRNR